jgi:uncharacterized membrane protein
VVPLGAVTLSVQRAEDVVVAGALLALARHLARPYPFPAVAPGRLVGTGVAAYVAVFSFITVTRHLALRTHALDLGIYDQITWHISRGLTPRTSLPEMHAWGDHLTLVLYLLAPLYVVAPTVLTMLVAQCAALAAGALAAYRLAGRRLPREWAALVAVLYLLSPTLHGINIRDFHPQALAIPLLLTGLYLFEAGRSGAFWVVMGLTLATREDAALALLGLGLWALVIRRRYATGAVLAVVGLVWLLAATMVIIPHFRAEPYPHLGRYAYLGGSVGEIVLNAVRRPWLVVGTLVSGSRLVYLLSILAPLGFLPLLAPAWVVPALPALAENLLATDPVLFHHRTQYNVFVWPFLVAAAIAGLAVLRARASEPVAWRVVGGALLVSVVLTARTVNDLMVTHWWPTERTRAARAFVALVPPLARVSAGERFVPHLTHRPGAFVFPRALDRADYVLVDVVTVPPAGYALERQDGRATLRTADGATALAYDVLGDRAGLVLLRRR